MDLFPLLRIRGYLVGSLVGRVVFFLDFLADPMVLLCCNALQVLAETKTLWEHLNSPAATTQFLRPRDSACIGEEFAAMASMPFDITMRC